MNEWSANNSGQYHSFGPGVVKALFILILYFGMLGLEDLARDVLKQGHSRRSDGVGDHRVLGGVHGPKVTPECGQYDFEPRHIFC